MEEKVGQEIDIESSIDTVTKLEKDDKRIVNVFAFLARY